MFNKKCSKCNTKIKGNYDYCPSCGFNLKSEFDEKDYGLLGRNDTIQPKEPDLFEGMGFAGLPLGKILKGAMKELPAVMKMLEKQMEEVQKENNNPNNKNQFPNNKMNVQFFVDGKKVQPTANNQTQKTEKTNNMQKEISKEKIKMLAKFPKVEPKSEVRRLSGRVVYNIYIPGVQSIDDVFINQLENSIEIKALGEDKVYSKTLKLNLPIKNYELINNNLVLELVGE